MKHPWRNAFAVVTAVATAAVFVVPASASTRHRWREEPPVRVVATGLNGPSGLASAGWSLVVAETDAGQVTAVNPWTGATQPLLKGLTGPAGVDVIGHRIAVVTGGQEVPDATVTGDSTVFVSRRWGQPPLAIADLEAYELANNPDGQMQFDPTTHAPLDALSNPFALLGRRQGGFAFVADAGANDVLSISRWGEVSTFFVPPLVTTGLCAGAPNNDPEHVGCDPVPTGLAYGPHNSLYVSTLSALTPGEGRVYVLDARTAHVRRVIDGLDGPTGVAVGPDGAVYVSEVTYGAPEGEGPPPPGFDATAVGRIVRIARDGTRTVAQVTMPLGLTFHNGTLYSTAWSIAGMLGMKDAGQVVAVSPRAFS